MRKLISSLFVIVFGLFLVSSANLKANEEHIVEAIDGASIRNKSGEEIPQGLRFYAKLNDEADEHGFYLVFGEATIFDLEDALRDQGTDEFAIVNGKEVFRVKVPGVTAKNEFSVVLTGIPGPGYLQKISVFPFAVVDGEETFVDPVTRSVGEVALKAANADDESGDVIPYLEENYKRMHVNYEGNVALTGNMFELNHLQLREEFLKDWNAKFGLSLPDLEATTFFNSAKTGLDGAAGSNKDLSPSHLYKFFNDEFYEVKWGWLLDYMIDNCGIYHASRQSWAIQGDGTFWDDRLESNQDVLYNGDQLSYSIANFFNKENKAGSYTAIDFTTGNRYATVSNYNDKIYVDLNKYELFKIGDVIETGYPGDRAGYVFKHFLIGGEIYLSGESSVITEDDVVIQMIYEAIEYDIEFYLGEELLDELSTTYTIEDLIDLEPLDKEGYAFNGWYDNSELQGSPVTSIPKGSMGDKKFYADATQSEYVLVDVTYKLNGGKLNDHEDLIEFRDSTLIVATRYSATGDNTGNPITVGTGSGGTYWYVMGFKETGIDKVYELVGKGTNYTNPEAVIYVSYHDKIDSPYKAAIQSLYGSITAGHLVVIPWLPPAVTGSTSVDMFFMPQTALTGDVTVELQNPEPMPFEVAKEGHTFLGWFTDIGLENGPVESYPGYKLVDEVTTMTYYAKWESDIPLEDVAYILDVGYTSIVDAIAAASPGDVIKLSEGIHNVPFTVNKNNLTFTNVEDEVAVITAKITVGANMVGLKFEGLEFTGPAQIHAPAKLDEFVFINNYVYDLTLVATGFSPVNRVDANAFIRIYTGSGSNQAGNITIEDNEFKNINSDIITIDRTSVDKEINIKNNVFHNFATSAIRFDGGYNNGTYNITGNTFKHDTKGANNSVILFRAYASNSGVQIINILDNEFINVGNASVGYDLDGKGHPGSGVILFGTFNDNPTEVYINNNLFKGTTRAIHFRNAGSKDDLLGDLSGNTFEDNDGYYLYQARPESYPAPEADFTGNIFKDANGDEITDFALISPKIINNKTYDQYEDD